MSLLIAGKVKVALSKKMSEVKLSFMTGAFHYKGAGANARSRVGAGEEYGARAEVEPLGEYLQD